MVWVSFFKLTNYLGLTHIPQEALDAPLGLVHDKDGNPIFSKTGRPKIKENKEISYNINVASCNLLKYDGNPDLKKKRFQELKPYIELFSVKNVTNQAIKRSDISPELLQFIQSLVLPFPPGGFTRTPESYIGNKRIIYHLKSCGSVKLISENNYLEFPTLKDYIFGIRTM